MFREHNHPAPRGSAKTNSQADHHRGSPTMVSKKQQNALPSLRKRSAGRAIDRPSRSPLTASIPASCIYARFWAFLKLLRHSRQDVAHVDRSKRQLIGKQIPSGVDLAILPSLKPLRMQARSLDVGGKRVPIAAASSRAAYACTPPSTEGQLQTGFFAFVDGTVGNQFLKCGVRVRTRKCYITQGPGEKDGTATQEFTWEAGK